ncbi:MAG: PEP-CTERM sorting domain-containing protein [Microcystis aeruginosa L111-01]|nr:PEP-CTERM sorting domain-containing protein [Microcystis aeruginosa L111-01]
MTKLLRFTIPSAVAAVLGLATAPVQAATVGYIGCANAPFFCTLTDLFAGGSITVDEDDDGTIDKTFDQWSKNGTWTPPTGLQVTAFGAPLSAGIDFTTTDGWTTPDGFSNQFVFNITTAPNLVLNSTFTMDLLNYNAIGTSVVSVSGNSAMVSSQGPVTVNASFAGSPGIVNLTVMGSTYSFPPLPQGTANIRKFQLIFGQRSRVPEPGTVVGLLAVGSLGLAMKRRQKDN